MTQPDRFQPSDELLEQVLARRAARGPDPDLLRLIVAGAEQAPQARRWWPVGLPWMSEPTRRLVWLAVVLMLLTVFAMAAIVAGGLPSRLGLVVVPLPPSPAPRAAPSASPGEVTKPGWIATGDMLQGRADDHTATLLPNGKVLVAGAGPITAELYDPATGRWTATANMADSRGYHTATRLGDGTVLVVGGDPSALASAELYDPVSGAWSATGSMAVGRAGHVAALLPDGRVLVAGGQDAAGVPLATAELYDPASGSWTATGAMTTARVVSTVTPLLDGRVLVAGDQDGAGDTSATAELYDPATGSWTATEEMHERRSYGTATRLEDGTVLVAGGGVNESTRSSAELYDPQTGSWTMTGRMIDPHAQHIALRLSDGTVLVAGGDPGAAVAERYDPVTGSWSTAGKMTEWRASPSATMLRDGRVLVAAGFTQDASASTELFDVSGPAPEATEPPWLSRCELGCHGPVLPGEFTSAGFAPGLRLTFADDSWFNAADVLDKLQFEQASNVLRFWWDPGASSKTDELLPDVPRTPEGLTDWMTANRDMVVSSPELVTIGDGIAATTLTVQVSDTNVNVDPGCPGGVRSCLSLLWLDAGYTFAIGYGDAIRFYLFTIGDGADAQTVAISLEAPSMVQLNQLTAELAPTLESLRLP